jgi:rubrerythrin
MAIGTLEDLQDHLLLATRVELSTIPIYLSAMYSIKDQESEAARLIASVVVEEMLHVCLVTNLLLSVGGEPDFGYASIPTYPGLMAHHKPDLMLELRRCTIELIHDVFMAIESPKARDAPNEDDEYETLGQFYGALEEAIDRLDDEHEDTVFANHQPERQLSDPSFYAPVQFDAEDSGGLILVNDGASADRALETIIDQGEGLSDHRWADPAHEELTHYYKFKQIADGDTPLGEVWPVLESPRTEDLPREVQPVSELFNAMYGLMYVTMGELFSGTHDQAAGIGRLYALMSSCLAPTARYLVSVPISDTNTAAPTFEIFRFSTEPWTQTTQLANSVGEAHPTLAPVVQTISAIRPTRDQTTTG